MAKHVIVKRSDDLGAPGDAETVTLSFNGREIEVDLSNRNRVILERYLEKYFEVGRPVLSKSQIRNNVCDLKRIRSWAAKNGYVVSDRGRIPGVVMKAYEASNVITPSDLTTEPLKASDPHNLGPVASSVQVPAGLTVSVSEGPNPNIAVEETNPLDALIHPGYEYTVPGLVSVTGLSESTVKRRLLKMDNLEATPHPGRATVYKLKVVK